MMKLKVKCSVPEGEIIYIKVNDEVKELYSFESFTVFKLDEKKQYVLEIERRPDKSNRSLINLLIFVVTIIIQGLFNALLMNVDTDWFNRITPYGMKAKIIIDVNEDTEVNLVYVSSKYNKNKCIKPKLNTDVGKITSINYIINKADFKNQYFNYVKRLLSVYSLVLALFNFLLIVAMKNNILYAALFMIFIMVILLLGLIITFIRQHRKLSNILKNFNL